MMRACQPGPVLRKCSTTSASIRSLSACLGLSGRRTAARGISFQVPPTRRPYHMRAPHACSRIFDFQVRPARSIFSIALNFRCSAIAAAARAGKTTAYYWGDEIGKNNPNCNGCGSQWDSRQSAPVGWPRGHPMNSRPTADCLPSAGRDRHRQACCGRRLQDRARTAAGGRSGTNRGRLRPSPFHARMAICKPSSSKRSHGFETRRLIRRPAA